jgi:hypothetical protein
MSPHQVLEMVDRTKVAVATQQPPRLLGQAIYSGQFVPEDVISDKRLHDRYNWNPTRIGIQEYEKPVYYGGVDGKPNELIEDYDKRALWNAAQRHALPHTAAMFGASAAMSMAAYVFMEQTSSPLLRGGLKAAAAVGYDMAYTCLAFWMKQKEQACWENYKVL